MRAVELIRRKRDGHPLADDDIAWLVQGIASGEVPHYQWAALLMAIVWRGLDPRETTALTRAMLESGIQVDLSHIPAPKVDKHSTGGVGDKTSLILAPIAAACGVVVPMVSGRGLGHTGGTLDKLEAIPGFRVHLNLQEFRDVLAACGLALAGQTDEIAPADRTLYALRDATATVESIPLITASILSKKLAEGIEGLVLDVKTGTGAFMTRLDDARALAQSLTAICRKLGTKVVALLTRMDQPLGYCVGNALEVQECIACLRGTGPADLMTLSVELAAEMIVLGRLAPTLEVARLRARQAIDDGSALDRLRSVIRAQGGDARVVDDVARLPKASCLLDVPAPRSGYLARLCARELGLITMRLGAGRARVDSAIDHAVGLVLRRKLGDRVQKGESLATIHARDPRQAQAAASNMLDHAFTIGDEPPMVEPLIIERLD